MNKDKAVASLASRDQFRAVAAMIDTGYKVENICIRMVKKIGGSAYKCDVAPSGEIFASECHQEP